jgi:hypothetical protein
LGRHFLDDIFGFFYLCFPAAEFFWNEIYEYHPKSEKVNTMPDKKARGQAAGK